jgi:hypothetical protein
VASKAIGALTQNAKKHLDLDPTSKLPGFSFSSHKDPKFLDPKSSLGDPILSD